MEGDTVYNIANVFSRGQLYCNLTKRYLNNLPHHIRQHLNGRRFQKAINSKVFMFSCLPPPRHTHYLRYHMSRITETMFSQFERYIVQH